MKLTTDIDCPDCGEIIERVTFELDGETDFIRCPHCHSEIAVDIDHDLSIECRNPATTGDGK